LGNLKVRDLTPNAVSNFLEMVEVVGDEVVKLSIIVKQPSPLQLDGITSVQLGMKINEQKQTNKQAKHKNKQNKHRC